MLKRLVVGLVLGILVGALAAALLIKGLGIATFATGVGVAVAYASAAVVGLLTGLVAGKPIWSKGGQIEAGLKAFFGALLAAGGMFALRKWAAFPLDLTAFDAGAGSLGDLPIAALPIVGGVLGAFFELDNTGGDEAKEGADAKTAKDAKTDKGAPNAADAKRGGKRVASPSASARVAQADAIDDDEDELPPAGRAKNAKRTR
jgi:hypothetical protein